MLYLSSEEFPEPETHTKYQIRRRILAVTNKLSGRPLCLKNIVALMCADIAN